VSDSGRFSGDIIGDFETPDEPLLERSQRAYSMTPRAVRAQCNGWMSLLENQARALFARPSLRSVATIA
jgi:hypothetical protein